MKTKQLKTKIKEQYYPEFFEDEHEDCNNACFHKDWEKERLANFVEYISNLCKEYALSVLPHVAKDLTHQSTERHRQNEVFNNCIKQTKENITE